MKKERPPNSIPAISADRLGIEYARPLLMLEGLFKRYPGVIPVARQLSEYKYEFWHLAMTAQVYEIIIADLFLEGDISRKDLSFFDLGTLAAFFHDIGKLGVDPLGIDQSLEIMNWVPDSQKAARPGRDLRPPDIRARHHLHPTISGYIVEEMAEKGAIPKGIKRTVASSVSVHHENHSDGFKTSYPQQDKSFEEQTHRLALRDLLIQLADIAVSMRERRDYRKKELDYPTIKFELESYLQNEKFLDYIRPALKFFDRDLGLKEMLIEKVLRAVTSVDKIIREIPDLSLIEWFGSNEAPGEHISLEQLFAQVWKDHLHEIAEEYESSLKQDYNHSSRNMTTFSMIK